MEKKEFYRHYLPHFQQAGQAYFVTWCLKDAVPSKALRVYTQKLEILKSQMTCLGLADSVFSMEIESNFYRTTIPVQESELGKPKSPGIKILIKEYDAVIRKYNKACDNLLDAKRYPLINLTKPQNTEVIISSLKFWEGSKINNCAFTIMSNHVHWVFVLLEKDRDGKAVYLQDLMQSVKRFSANRINKLENRQGSLWQKESFDTTIRNERHMQNAIAYTLNNPVVAGLVSEWKLWPGSFSGPTWSSDF
jgi:REP element-mobilizing transposase RayT